MPARMPGIIAEFAAHPAPAQVPDAIGAGAARFVRMDTVAPA